MHCSFNCGSRPIARPPCGIMTTAREIVDELTSCGERLVDSGGGMSWREGPFHSTRANFLERRQDVAGNCANS